GRSSEAAERNLGEGCGIEPGLPCALVARQVAALAGNQVGARTDAGAGGIDVGRDRSGEAALESHDRGKLPAVQRLLREAVQVAREWQVIQHRLHEPLRYVEAADRAIALHVVDVLGRADEGSAAHLATDVGRA